MTWHYIIHQGLLRGGGGGEKAPGGPPPPPNGPLAPPPKKTLDYVNCAWMIVLEVLTLVWEWWICVCGSRRRCRGPAHEDGQSASWWLSLSPPRKINKKDGHHNVKNVGWHTTRVLPPPTWSTAITYLQQNWFTQLFPVDQLIILHQG